ncbi:hypothetical protein [Salinirarus marinus]
MDDIKNNVPQHYIPLQATSKEGGIPEFGVIGSVEILLVRH